MRGLSFLAAAAALALGSLSPAFAEPAGASGAEAGLSAFSAQERRSARRTPARPRITVRPVRPGLPPDRDLSRYRRLCEPVFEERWIPQWGGNVLYAGERCRWVRL